MAITEQTYTGFEQGPIRPPSEAKSLLIRVMRNCPWNRCAFCPVYKGSKFSLRPVDHVLRDIDAVHRHLETLLSLRGASGLLDHGRVREAWSKAPPGEAEAFGAANHWLAGGGMKSVFLQDANALIVKPPQLLKILRHLRHRFPDIERVTCYARSQTVAARKQEDLNALGAAGLNRVHIGLESGSDRVLEMVRKGVTKEKQIEAGSKIKAAGMELSEYYMPGLGGRALSEEHARESAGALNRIGPDFIRLRTLAIPNGVPLAAEQEAGRFVQLTGREVVEELVLFLESLDGITSTIASDHVLNLFGDLEGVLPADKERMLGLLRGFLGLDPNEQSLYQVGRRLGIFACLEDLGVPRKRAMAEQACATYGIGPENADEAIGAIMKRFI